MTSPTVCMCIQLSRLLWFRVWPFFRALVDLFSGDQRISGLSVDLTISLLSVADIPGRLDRLKHGISAFTS